jgi:hypothetical protein
MYPAELMRISGKQLFHDDCRQLVGRAGTIGSGIEIGEHYNWFQRKKNSNSTPEAFCI